MAPRRNPLKLNPLQLRTLALLQELARDPETGKPGAASGEVAIPALPRPHGDHVHVGRLVVSARRASGLSNPSVWAALERKGLARFNARQSAEAPGEGGGAAPALLTRAGADYDTGLEEAVARPSDH